MESTIHLTGSRRPGTAFLAGTEDYVSAGQNPDLQLVPESLVVAMAAAEWMVKVREFRRAEAHRLKDDSYDKLREEHRALVVWLLSKGEQLSAAWERIQDMPKLPFTLPDLQAVLEGLSDTYVCEHRPSLTSQARQTILASFDEQE